MVVELTQKEKEDLLKRMGDFLPDNVSHVMKFTTSYKKD